MSPSVGEGHAGSVGAGLRGVAGLVSTDRGVHGVPVAIAALRRETDLLDAARVRVLLLVVRLLRGEETLEVRLHLALLRASLEPDEVRDGDGGEDVR